MIRGASILRDTISYRCAEERTADNTSNIAKAIKMIVPNSYVRREGTIGRLMYGLADIMKIITNNIDVGAGAYELKRTIIGTTT